MTKEEIITELKRFIESNKVVNGLPYEDENGEQEFIIFGSSMNEFMRNIEQG